MKNWIKNNRNYIILFILATIICIPLISKYENVFFDDGIQHIAKSYGAFESIGDGQIIPNIMINFCNGFGYSWNIFYGPISTFFPLIFRIFTDSYIVCYKLTLFAGLFLSRNFYVQICKKIY